MTRTLVVIALLIGASDLAFAGTPAFSRVVAWDTARDWTLEAYWEVTEEAQFHRERAHSMELAFKGSHVMSVSCTRSGDDVPYLHTRSCPTKTTESHCPDVPPNLTCDWRKWPRFSLRTPLGVLPVELTDRRAVPRARLVTLRPLGLWEIGVMKRRDRSRARIMVLEGPAEIVSQHANSQTLFLVMKTDHPNQLGDTESVLRIPLADLAAPRAIERRDRLCIEGQRSDPRFSRFTPFATAADIGPLPPDCLRAALCEVDYRHPRLGIKWLRAAQASPGWRDEDTERVLAPESRLPGNFLCTIDKIRRLLRMDRRVPKEH